MKRSVTSKDTLGLKNRLKQSSGRDDLFRNPAQLCLYVCVVITE